jgi:hypothetical protein
MAAVDQCGDERRPVARRPAVMSGRERGSKWS